MSKEQVLLSLGSNRCYFMGGRKLSPYEILRCAVAQLRKVLCDVKVSAIYRTAPMYVTDQSDFYNMAVTGSYDTEAMSISLGAHKLLNDCQAIEARYGRDRKSEVHKGPRTLDIDIVLFGGETINDDTLTVPHALMWERAFVLVPSLEVLSSAVPAVWHFAVQRMKAARVKCTERIEKAENGGHSARTAMQSPQYKADKAK